MAIPYRLLDAQAKKRADDAWGDHELTTTTWMKRFNASSRDASAMRARLGPKNNGALISQCARNQAVRRQKLQGARP